MSNKPQIIKGGYYNDERGTMRFVNDFQFNDIKRFYFIKHTDIKTIRAWQGHQFEKKYFYPISGSFIVAWVKIDNFENPSKDLIPEHHVLSANNSEILEIPKGYANGLKALEPNSEVLVLSDMKLQASINEKNRYPSNYWLNWDKF
jgi:dTDP-4-dehydrorhamnose 3,5-epimerase